MKQPTHNVADLAEERRRREERQAGEPRAVSFIGWKPYSPPPVPKSDPMAQALLAGLMQGIGERSGDAQMVDAGRRLAEAAIEGHQAAQEERKRLGWLRRLLGLLRPRQR
jgi:hypothetical protein